MERENRRSISTRKSSSRHKSNTTGDCGPTSQSSGTVVGNDNTTITVISNPPQNQNKNNKSKITRNPFINFFMEFRKKYPTLSNTQSAKEAAKIWKSMDESEKAPYLASARMAPKRKNKSKRKKYDDGCDDDDDGYDDDDDDDDSESTVQSAGTSRSGSRTASAKRHRSKRERSNNKRKR